MNLRTLKKLSKRAAPLLPLLGDRREQFRAIIGDDYHKTGGIDLKHWERHGSRHDRPLFGREAKIIAPKARAGTEYPYIHLCPPSHPRQGTVMVGGMDGGEQPEWDEQCAWSALVWIVEGQFTDYDTEADTLRLTRPLRYPSQVFKAAAEIIEERRIEEARRKEEVRRRYG